jgi:hypothetical protein
VEVVEVEMRDEDGIDVHERLDVDRPDAPQVHDAGAEQWVRQEAHAVELDEDRRVSDVEDARRHEAGIV